MEDDDDPDYGLTETQAEAKFDREMREFEERYRNMTPLQRYIGHRRVRLNLCLKARRAIRMKPESEMLRQILKDTQRRMVEQRMEYRTGIVAGHA